MSSDPVNGPLRESASEVGTRVGAKTPRVRSRMSAAIAAVATALVASMLPSMFMLFVIAPTPQAKAACYASDTNCYHEQLFKTEEDRYRRQDQQRDIERRWGGQQNNPVHHRGPTGVSFGAIAYSPQSRQVGMSKLASSAENAEQSAVQFCSRKSHTDDCYAVLWYRNACGAIAVGTNGVVGWGSHDSSAEESHPLAVKGCAQKGGTECKPVASQCSD
jgi:Domain of unknown function (DUF4189)